MEVLYNFSVASLFIDDTMNYLIDSVTSSLLFPAHSLYLIGAVCIWEEETVNFLPPFLLEGREKSFLTSIWSNILLEMISQGEIFFFFFFFKETGTLTAQSVWSNSTIIQLHYILTRFLSAFASVTTIYTYL